MHLKNATSTFLITTLTDQYFSGNAAYFVVIVPSEFSARSNVSGCEKCHPRKSKIMRVNEYVLYEEIRST